MKCVICGKEIAKSRYTGDVICSGECFTKNYWRKVIAEKDKHIVINGVCYCDAGNVDNPLSTSELGHSGRRFWIRFKDGRTLTTNNLWCQSEIPQEFRSELPDTAEFYTPEHIKYAIALKQDIHGKGEI